MGAGSDQALASDLLFREALYLDERRWDDWLALYDEQAEYWIPAWKSEDTPTSDPESEVSLVYISARAPLEERVARVRSGRSIASTPMPRTAHCITNILIEESDDNALTVRSLCTTHVYNVKRHEQHLFFCRYEHRLQRAGDSGRILRKKIVLLNDYLPTMLDFCTV